MKTFYLLIITSIVGIALIIGLIGYGLSPIFSKIDFSGLTHMTGLDQFHSKIVAVELDYNFPQPKNIAPTQDQNILGQIAGINKVEAADNSIQFSNLPLNYELTQLKQRPALETNPVPEDVQAILIPVINLEFNITNSTWNRSKLGKILEIENIKIANNSIKDLVTGDILILTTKHRSYYYEITDKQADLTIELANGTISAKLL